MKDLTDTVGNKYIALEINCPGQYCIVNHHLSISNIACVCYLLNEYNNRINSVF